MKECENCKQTHEGFYGSGRFCSSKCARGFSTKNKRKEINEKVSKTLTGSGNDRVNLICEICEIKFDVDYNRRHQLYCSNKCSSIIRWKDDEYRSKIVETNRAIATNRHASNETGFGWQVRNKLAPSYPESIAIRILKELNIKYEREMQIDRYFADFAIHSKMIIIEIDGQQHNKPERIKIDKRKDNLLKEKGWTVYRIKWPKENIIESIKEILRQLPKGS